MTLPITPETKVGELLDAYPSVEAVLIDWVPAFRKLRNPIVRKTVAKAATLGQAARIGGVSLAEMLGKIREAVGQAGPSVSAAEGELPADSDASTAWLETCTVAEEIDADQVLESGAHPLGKIRECLAKLKPGEVVRLRSSFRPEPLINLMRRDGLPVHCAAPSSSEHVTYVGLKGN